MPDWWEGLSAASLRGEFHPDTIRRGAGYARGKRVLSLTCEATSASLSAHVVGQGRVYETRVAPAGDGYRTDCTCPVKFDCKHAVAVLLAAAADGPDARAPRGRAGNGEQPRDAPSSRARPSAPAPRPWETRLRGLLAAHDEDRRGDPLAVELRLTSSEHRPGIGCSARPMRPGARGGWINGSLGWGGLDGWSVRDEGLRPDHLELLRDLRAACRRDPPGGYGWSGARERTLDLAGTSTARLWPLLQRARELGVTLRQARPVDAEIPPALDGELVFDIAREDSGGAVIRAALRLDDPPDDEPLQPIGLLGAPAHGVLYTPVVDLELALERRRIRVARLRRPLTPELTRMLTDEPLRIAAAELDTLQAIVPGLARIAPILSHDDSFTAPTVSGPELVLRVEHGPAGRLTLDWEWAYAVGERVVRPRLVPGSAGPDPVRDPRLEDAARRAVALEEPLLADAELLDRDGHPAPRAPVTVSGSLAMRICTELLPRLADHPGVGLRVIGSPPEYRDVTDTLEISVSTSELDGGRDWFGLDVSISVTGIEVPFAEVFRALALGQERMMLEGGGHFALDDPRLTRLRELIEEARGLAETPGGPLRISRFQTGLWSELAEVAGVAEQAERWRTAVAPLLHLDALPEPPEPAGLEATLRPYQREGFAWLATLWQLGLGGILADDMGLGKTVQTLALILHARERDPGLGPCLVVTPTSVATNWAAEAARFAPGLSVEVVLDTLARSGRAIEQIAGADMVITTYTLARLDAEAHRAAGYAGVILDEAQFVKNPRSKTHRCLRDLGAPFMLAVTGTPLENNLMDLWSLLALAAPGLFPDPQRFTSEYARPITRDGDAARLARLRRRLRPVMMRRTKELVASELPPKQEQTLAVELHPRHRRVYDTHLARERARVLALLDDFDDNRIAILRALTRLRQLSLHPALVDGAHDEIPCAKLDALCEHLEEVVASGHRALVFSQFTRFLALARERLERTGIGHCYLDGATRRRETVIERFRTGSDPVFLISLKAGGVGLNLTEADYCFLLDPWWNPATEAQAIGRAHRIGQTERVLAYRLIARDTIEEKVRALAEAKAELFAGVMDEGALFSGPISAEDVRGLLA